MNREKLESLFHEMEDEAITADIVAPHAWIGRRLREMQAEMFAALAVPNEPDNATDAWGFIDHGASPKDGG